MKKEEKMLMLMLDKEQIAARRVPLEDAQILAGKQSHFHCHYCEKSFSNEVIFMRHICTQKKKALEFISPAGQAAYAYYNDWMTARKFSRQTGDAFLSSKFFSAFIKFAEFVKKMNIAKPDRYVRLMVESNLQPVLWCRDDCYKIYLASFDKNEDPIKDVQDTINFLIDLCIKEEIITNEGYPDLGKIVSHLGAQRIIGYLRNKNITPWIIFTADSFRSFVKGLDDEHRKVLDNTIKISYWYDKLVGNPKITSQIKEITSGMGM